MYFRRYDVRIVHKVQLKKNGLEEAMSLWQEEDEGEDEEEF